MLLNSDSATAWILVALSLPEHDTLRIIKVLKQAITASNGSNPSQDADTTRQFLQQLKETRATSGLTRAIDAVLADRMLW